MLVLSVVFAKSDHRVERAAAAASARKENRASKTTDVKDAFNRLNSKSIEKENE